MRCTAIYSQMLKVSITIRSQQEVIIQLSCCSKANNTPGKCVQTSHITVLSWKLHIGHGDFRTVGRSYGAVLHTGNYLISTTIKLQNLRTLRVPKVKQRGRIVNPPGALIIIILNGGISFE
jgi:hypothetical protein